MNKNKDDTVSGLKTAELEQVLNDARNTIVRNRLASVSFILGILYTLFTVYYFFLLTDRARLIASVVSAVTAVAMFLTSFITKKRTPNLAAVNPIVLFEAVLILMNAMAHLMLTGQIWQTTVIILLVVGSGFFYLSTNTVITIIVLCGYCWLSIAWKNLSSPIWIYYGLGLLTACFISILVHIVRGKKLELAELLRLRDEFHDHKMKEVKAELDNQDPFYWNFFENASDLIQSVDQNGMFRYVNRRWKEIMGYSAEDLPKTNFRQIIASENLSEWDDSLQSIVPGKEMQSIKTVFIKKDGQKIFVEGNLAGQFHNGCLVAVYGIFHETDSGTKTENVLMQEGFLLRTLIDNIPEAIYAKDKEMRKILVNKTDLANIGKSESEVLGKTDLEVYPPEIANKFMEDDRAVLINGRPVVNREELLINEAGQKMWLLTSKLPLYDNQNQIIGLVGIGTNITELKIAKEQMLNMHFQLQELNTKLSLAYEDVRNQKDNLSATLHREEMALLLNSKGVILGTTEETLRVTGFTRLEMIGKSLIDLLEPESRPELVNLLTGGMIVSFKSLKIRFVLTDSDFKDFYLGLNRVSMEKERLFVAILREI